MRSHVPFRTLTKLFLKTPHLIPFLARGLLRKHIGADRDYRRGDGVASKPPYQISLRITNACNHRCDICGQYGSKGYMRGGNGKHLLNDLPLDVYKEVVDQVASYRPLFYVTGGEPLLYQNLPELMSYVKQQRCYASVVTNGVTLEKCAERIVRDGWDMLMVSFDGPEDVHDRCRNFPGAYETAVKGIREVNRWKRKLSRTLPYVMTSTTLSRNNVRVLTETLEIGEDIMPDFMVVYLSWFTNEAIGQEHVRVLEGELGVTPSTWKSYVTEFSSQEGEEFAQALKTIRNRKWKFDHVIVPNLSDDDVRRYYTEPSEMFGFKKCVAPFIMVDVMPNGDVVTCRDYIDVKVGNITDKPLLDIWNDEPMQRFRKLLIKRGGMLPQCHRCCGLMGF